MQGIRSTFFLRFLLCIFEMDPWMFFLWIDRNRNLQPKTRCDEIWGIRLKSGEIVEANTELLHVDRIGKISSYF